MLELQPVFLATSTSKLLFFSGALLTGSTMSGVFSSLGFAEQGVDRLAADLVLGVCYYFICRLAFAVFQRPCSHMVDSKGAR